MMNIPTSLPRQSFLCMLCKRIDEAGQISYQLQELHPVSRDGRRKRSSCAFCDILWRVLVELLGEGLIEVYGTLMLLEREIGGPMRADLLPLDKYQQKVRKLRLQFFVEKDAKSPFKRIGSASQIAKFGASHAYIELAQSWIGECEKSHEGCKVDDPPFLPTRVVDVGSWCTDPHLHISTQGERARYVALSHCWGGSSPLTTTSATLQSHLKRISYSDLPLTLRDAVKATRSLEVKYLWIDSLCIIQDSHDDWESEATRMASVYEDAYVTIAADAASDCHSGFLQEPGRKVSPCVSVPFNLRALMQEHVQGVLYLREKGVLMRQLPVHGWHSGSIVKEPPLPKTSNALEEPTIPPCLEIFNEAPTSKLSTRGWVMQERMLSPRTLHFGPSEVGWECRSCISCECTYTSVRSRRGGPLLKGSLAKGDWHKIVREYTRMSLTVASDRLPALSGLASAMSRQLASNDEYSCGLWKSTMAQDLLWYKSSIIGEDWEEKPRKAPNAPTWSWACRNQPVQYNPTASKISPTFKVLDIHLKPSSINPYGAVGKDSYIEVSGLCIPVRIGERYDFKSPKHALFIDPDVEKLKRYPDSWPQIRAIRDYLKYEGRKSTQLFLLIADGEHAVEGLLLSESKGTGLEGNVYERTGYAVSKQDAPLKKCKYYSTDSTEYEEVQPGFPAWPTWAGLAKEMTLKII